MASPHQSTQVAVVGGGLAGLAAALELQAAGLSVVVLEKASSLGGKAGSVDTTFGPLPTGPVSFNGRQPIFWRLLERLGLQDRAVALSPRSGARFIVRGGRLKGIRPHPMSVLTTGALTWSDKLRFARDLFASSAAPPEADESMDAFLERRFGRDLVDHFLAAVFSGIFAGDLRQLSARACIPALVSAEREYGSALRGFLKGGRKPAQDTKRGLYTFKEGFSAIAAAAAQKLSPRTLTEVSTVAKTPTGVRIEGRDSDGPFTLDAQELVLATEAFCAPPLLSSLAPRASKLLAELPYAPITLLQWVEREPGESGFPLGFGYLSAPVEQRFALGTLFISDLMDETPRRFSTFVGGALAPERAGLGDDELWKAYAEDLAGLTGGRLGTPLKVVRWPQAVFQPPVGHLERLAALQDSLAGLPVTLAGSYLGGAAMKDALTSGFLAAERVMGKLQVTA
jgi:oxygen-dependent protoporphyrinogen oxidase